MSCVGNLLAAQNLHSLLHCISHLDPLIHYQHLLWFYFYLSEGELIADIQSVAFLPPPHELVFATHVLKIVVMVKVLGMLHIIKLWLG